MLYAALTLWLLVIVFCAWGVHRIWSALVKPRVVNTVLLPGTLVAQLGHVLGLLVTGNPVRNTALMGDDEKGDPKSDTPERQRIPIIGPIIVGMLPLVACTVGLFVSAEYLGSSVLGGLTGASSIEVPRALPASLAEFWALLHGSIDVMERMLDAIIHSDLPNWPTALFLYLAVCLTVRMAPFEGNQRGSIGAIMLAGVVIAIVSSLTSTARDLVLSSWPILSFAVGMLLFLLLVSLFVSGLIGLVRILARKE